MNRFDARKQTLINLITGSHEYITGKALSAKLGCSVRTVQSEISAINQELPGLILSTNRGYLLNKEIAQALNVAIQAPEKNDEHSILRKLIFDSPWPVEELSDYLYISTTTLEKRLKTVASILSGYRLTLTRKNASLSIEGAESDKRSLIKQLILDETNNNFNTVDNMAPYFPDIDIERIRSIVCSSIRKFGYFVENVYAENLIINIVIALYRMRSDNYISQAPIPQDTDASAEYQIAEEICGQYSAHWGIRPSALDISYLASLLTGQIKPLTSAAGNTPSMPAVTQDFLEDIRAILTEVFQFYMLDVDFSDILYGFAIHVDAALKRALHCPAENNDILQNLKRSCPFIYDVSVSIAQRLTQKYKVTLPDSEIGYISIHIGFLIEQAAENPEKVYVLLLGQEYRQIGSIIEKRLRESFSDLIEIQFLKQVDSKTLERTSCDLILTVQPLSVLGKRVVTISPFYTVEDQLQVSQAIQSCLKEKKRLFQKRLFSSYFHEKLFFKREDFSCKEEVIRFLGQKIVDFGLCEPAFIDSVLEREELSSTCFFNSFAIPHAITMDAAYTMNCILISENGIPWDEHRIHLVMMIAVSSEDRKDFMKLYDGIVQSLENPNTVKALAASRDFTEFMGTLTGRP